MRKKEISVSSKRGKVHVSPVKPTNHAGKMTLDEAKASLAHIQILEKQGVGEQVKRRCYRQRVKALRRRIEKGGR